MSVLVDEPNIRVGKEALLRAKARLNCDVRVVTGTDVESIGTRPKAVREVVGEEKPSEEKKEGEEKKGEKAEEKKEEGAEKKEGSEKKAKK
jgi:hypothetical protein